MSIPSRCVLLLLHAFALAACQPFLGSSSVTLLAPIRPPSANITGDPVEEEVCSNMLLLAYWGEHASHETLVARALERSGAHALVDAEITRSSYGVPFVYVRECATVRGRPARFDGGAR